MEDVIDMGWYRFAYGGPEVRFPRRAFPKTGVGCSPNDIDWDAAQAWAQQYAEWAKSGVSVALPNDINPVSKDFEWQIKLCSFEGIRLDGLLDVIKYLKDELATGIGIPPELLEASETGSGWSGRKVPLIAFYTSMLKNARAIVHAFQAQILDGLVRWNFGPKARYEVEVVLKIPDVLSPQEGGPMNMQQGAGAAPAGAPPGGSPPAGGGGGKGGNPFMQALQMSTAPEPEPRRARTWRDILRGGPA